MRAESKFMIAFFSRVRRVCNEIGRCKAPLDIRNFSGFPGERSEMRLQNSISYYFDW